MEDGQHEEYGKLFGKFIIRIDITTILKQLKEKLLSNSKNRFLHQLEALGM